MVSSGEPGSFSSVPLVPPVVPPLTASNTVDTLMGKKVGGDVEFHVDKVPATLPPHSGDKLFIVPSVREDSKELDKILDGE